MRTFHSLRLWLFFLLLCGLSATAQAYDGHGRLISYAQSGSVGLTHIYNGLGDRIATTTTPAGGIADTRRFVTAPDGRVLNYGDVVDGAL